MDDLLLTLDDAAGAVAAAGALPHPVRDGRPADFVRLGPRFDRAVAYAAWAHREQARKGGPTPYVAHLLGVASLVLEHGGDEDQAIAALLHDTIEDCGSEHAEAIGKLFGPDVLTIVRACSDAEVPRGQAKPPWHERKDGYLAHLVELGRGNPAVLVSAADKLHNARAVRADLRRYGLSVWERFSQPAPEQLWYYRRLVEVFPSLLDGFLPGELRRTVRDIVRINRALNR
jgi:(p)ppGpp synthase/HD superfamily hydrolase